MSCIPHLNNRWLPLAAALLLLAAFVFFVGPTAQSLVCEATTGAGYRCVFTKEGRQTAETTTFGSAEVGSIELSTIRSGKNSARGRIEVFNRQGVPRTVFEGSPDEAARHHGVLVRFVEAAVSGEQPDSVRIEQAPFLGGLGAPLLLVLIAGLAVLVPVGQKPSDESGTPRTAPWSTPFPWTIAFFVVFGVGLVAGVAVLGSRSSTTAATVEVHCKHRCRIGGVDCRPPGVWETKAPPGTYTVQVYTPDDPSGWSDISIQVEAGKRYVLVCAR